jgi:DNA-binding response OmpR family regulator
MKRILLIEDNQEIRENTAEILELSGYQVLNAQNGKIGVELAKKELPDLIICDVMMPELDGFGVLHILSKNTSTAGIPFIFLTAKNETEDRRKGMNLGADDYLTKPFDDLELLGAIEMRLKKQAILKDELKRSVDGFDDFLNQAKGLQTLDTLLNDEKRTISVPKKHLLYFQGGYPIGVYFILKGKIKTFRTDTLGNELITTLYNEGDFFGYTDLLEHSEYTENAVAIESAEICLIQKQDFFTLLYNNLDVANKFVKILSSNLIEKEERLLKLAYSPVRKRVAEALILLQNKYWKNSSEAFAMAISRDDLSNIAGASKETVIRILSDFKEEGLIHISGSTITLLKPDKLLSIKN